MIFDLAANCSDDEHQERCEEAVENTKTDVIFIGLVELMSTHGDQHHHANGLADGKQWKMERWNCKPFPKEREDEAIPGIDDGVNEDESEKFHEM